MGRRAAADRVRVHLRPLRVILDVGRKSVGRPIGRRRRPGCGDEQADDRGGEDDPHAATAAWQPAPSRPSRAPRGAGRDRRSKAPGGSRARRSEEEGLPVLELRPCLDQNAQSRRVDKGDLAEVDDQALRLLGAELEQRRAHLRRVVEVELADEMDHDCAIVAVDPRDRVLVQRRLVRHLVGKHSHVLSA